mgnify:CR=1 FL=1
MTNDREFTDQEARAAASLLMGLGVKRTLSDGCVRWANGASLDTLTIDDLAATFAGWWDELVPNWASLHPAFREVANYLGTFFLTEGRMRKGDAR